MIAMINITPKSNLDAQFYLPHHPHVYDKQKHIDLLMPLSQMARAMQHLWVHRQGARSYIKPQRFHKE
jgi:hypothetical protein